MLLFALFSPQACGVESRSCSTPWLCPLPAVWLEGVTETLQSQVVCVSRSIVSSSLGPPWTAARQPPLSLGILEARILEWGAIPFSRGFFPTQGLNPGSLRCRQILYHLSHQGSPQSHTVGKQDGSNEVSLPLGCRWELTGPLAWSLPSCVFCSLSCDSSGTLPLSAWEPA